MDWPGIKEGLRDWFAALADIDPAHVHWSGEPVGYGNDVEVFASVLSSRALGTDVQRQTENDLDANTLDVEAVGQRVIVVQWRIEARHSCPEAEAIAFAYRVRDRAELPGSVALLERAGLGLNHRVQCTPLPTRVVDGRELSIAALEVRFNATSQALDLEPLATVARVRVSGQVDADGTTITVPTRTHQVE